MYPRWNQVTENPVWLHSIMYVNDIIIQIYPYSEAFNWQICFHLDFSYFKLLLTFSNSWSTVFKKMCKYIIQYPLILDGFF